MAKKPAKKTTTGKGASTKAKSPARVRAHEPRSTVSLRGISGAARVKQAKVMAKAVPGKPPVSRKGFNKAELQHFREIILEKRKEILEELETLKASMMDVQTGEYVTENSTYSLHMEQGTDTMEREKTFLFASREGKFLNYLDDALKRIDKGEYGFCIDCGTLIDKERLEAVPHAQLCIKCKLKRGK